MILAGSRCLTMGLALLAGTAQAAQPDQDRQESVMIAANARWVQRDGPRLTIALPGFPPMHYDDRPCETTSDGDCIHYRLDAVFPDRDPAQPPLFDIWEGYYEGSSYTLLASNGVTVETGERPVPSPDGVFLVAAAWSEGHPPDTGLTLLQRSDHGLIKIVRIIPTGALTAFEDVRWVGSRCIAFRAAQVDGMGYGPQTPYRLSAATPEWRLTEGAGSCAGDISTKR